MLSFFEKRPHVRSIQFITMTLLILILAVNGAQALGVQGVALGVWITAIKFCMGFVCLYILYKSHVLGLLNNWSFAKTQYMIIGIWLLLLVPVIYLNGFKVGEGHPISIMLLAHQATGFYEEMMFRGVIFFGFLYAFVKSKASYAVMGAIFVSSLYFGAIHLINIFTGNPLGETLMQLISATIMGGGFALFVIITRNIWGACVLHGTVNSVDLGATYTFMPQDFVVLCFSIIIGIVSLLLYKTSYADTLVTDLKRRNYVTTIC